MLFSRMIPVLQFTVTAYREVGTYNSAETRDRVEGSYEARRAPGPRRATHPARGSRVVTRRGIGYGRVMGRVSAVRAVDVMTHSTSAV